MRSILMLIACISGLLLAACGGSDAKNKASTKEQLVEEVKQFEDSLKKGLLPEGDRNVSMRYADKCLAVYRNFPKSKEAPAYLDKAHVVLSGSGFHGIAVMYADTLIRKYPTYDNRPMVLQSLASSYDMFIIPRKKELVVKYYELLLKENPDLPKEERENIAFRLKHIDKTFEELIEMQTANLQ